MSGRVTIVDVARAAGVSKSTVSLVLNRSPLVADATRLAVEDAIATTGYVYNRSAATLRSGRVDLVGLVINDLRNPFFTEFAASAQEAFAAAGIATVIANSAEDPAIQALTVASMIEHGVGGFVVSPAYGGTEWSAAIARARKPALMVLRREDGADLPFASFDYRGGGAEATWHLIEEGARRIAFVGGLPERGVTLERLSGYRETLRTTGLPEHLLLGRPSRSFGLTAAGPLLAAGVDAALCFNDLVALGLQAGVAQAGGRMRIVGFDDIEESVLAGLSSVRCDIAGFGRAAAETLLGWLATGTPPPPETRRPVSLIPRRSSIAP